MRNIIHGGGGGNDFIPTRMTTSASFGSSTRGGGGFNEQPFIPGHSTNSSVAFGSTQPRNIDLTRPLVTPLPARPKSEIFPSGPSFELSSSTTMATTSSGGHGITQKDSSAMYAKDDSNYHSKRVTATVAAVDMTPHCLAPMQPTQPVATIEPVIMAKQQQSLQAPLFSASSFMRAARRHDPELIPAKQKYLFREYGSPSSSGTSWGGFRKENSIMTCSMTSTKSFQSKHPMTGVTGGSSALGSRPKKSYSMNRLDQLAQPRKRVQPRGS